MMIYDYLIISLLIICLISTTKINNRKLNMITQVTILTLVSGLRYQTIGSDFKAYKVIFENSIYGINTEFLYWILNFLVRLFTDNFNVFLIIVSFIINSIIVVIINKYSKMPNLSIVIYVIIGGYFGSFNIMRQYISVSLYWLILYYIFSYNKKVAFIISLISIFIHKSSLIILLITILLIKLSENLNKSKLILLLLLSPVFYLIEPYLKKIIGLVYYNNYLQNDMFDYGASVGLYCLELIIIIFVILNMRKDFKSYTNYEKFMIVSIIPSFIFSIIATRGVLYARLMTYFYMYKIILIPNLLYKKNKKFRILLIYICIVFLILYFILFERQDILIYKNLIQDVLF